MLTRTTYIYLYIVWYSLERNNTKTDETLTLSSAPHIQRWSVRRLHIHKELISTLTHVERRCSVRFTHHICVEYVLYFCLVLYILFAQRSTRDLDKSMSSQAQRHYTEP